MRKVCLFLFAVLMSVSSFSQSAPKEKFRPLFHFTPEQNWINDPNGLVYFGGEYHLFYQYNPQGNTWGHMSWGHAVSKDLIHWNELPLALAEENGVMIFSGSAVMDPLNTSGFVKKVGQVPMVAIYTGHMEGKNQSQHIAYSLDSGRTFTKFDFNPVLDLDLKDFRDPKVFWHDATRRWVMSVVVPDQKKIQFYQSKSLKAWNLMSDFGPAGDTTGIWECPDLFRAPIIGSPGNYKWVLMHSPAPYMQYFVGEFDGMRIKNESSSGKIYRPDYGPDYYAAVTYNNTLPAIGPVSIGWVNNWNYANEIPAGKWRGAMSLPRSIAVKKVGNEWILVQQPVDQLNALIGPAKSILTSNPIPLPSASFDLQWDWIDGGDGQIAEMVLGNQELVIRFDPKTREVELNRSGGSKGFTNEAFQKLGVFKQVVPGAARGQLHFRLLFDQSIAELYMGDGELVMTAQIFPDALESVRFTNTPEPVKLAEVGAYRR